MRVKRAIDNLSGVLHSDVQIGVATVAFDESRLKKEDIIAAVEKAGYKVSI
jgi:copper chaperone CopZ